MKRAIIVFSLFLALFISFSTVEMSQAKSVPGLGKIVYLKQNKHNVQFDSQKISCKVNTVCFSIANYTKHWVQLKVIAPSNVPNSSGVICSLNPSKILNNNTVCRINYGINAAGTWMYYDITDPKTKPLTVIVS